MTDDEVMKMYSEIEKILEDKQLDHALTAISIVIADLVYRTGAPMLQVMAMMNRSVFHNFDKLMEQEDESTKH